MRELAPGHRNGCVPSSPSQIVSLLLSLWNLSRALSAPALGVITAPGRAGQGRELILLERGKAPACCSLGLAKVLTPQPHSPAGMELDYPHQNEGGNADEPSPLIEREE